MGKTLRRVIGGLATGAGNYLVTKATEDAKTAREERLFQRQQVLDNLQFDRDLKKIDRQVEGQVKVREVDGVEDRKTALTTGTVTKDVDTNRAGLQRAQDEQKAKLEERLIRVRGMIDGKNERDAIALRDKLDSKKNPPTEVIETDTGSIVFFKNGNREVITHGRAPKQTGGGSSLQDLLGGDDQPVTEGGYKYTPGPGGRGNQANWTKL